MKAHFTNDQLNAMFERSKNDHTIFVGSEIRQLIGDIQTAREAASDKISVLTYTNHRGETGVRRIVPKSVRYGSTEWHPEPQLLLLAWDADKNADREFALKGFGPVTEQVASITKRDQG